MNLLTPPLHVPLGDAVHQQAQQFAREQPTLEKAKQVYLNTLAVHAVHRYLGWMQIDTPLDQGDWLHPNLRAFFDVADLQVPELGRLECRPVLPNQTEIVLPPEVMTDRIGYVFVQFGDRLDTCTLLGFLPLTPALPATIALNSQLRSVAELGHYLIRQPVLLQQWLQNAFDSVWQPIEALLDPEPGNPAFALMAGPSTPIAQRGRLIDLGLYLQEHTAVLLVALEPTPDNLLEVRVQLHPGRGIPFLPPGISLALLARSGRVIRDVTSRQNDYCIQLPPFSYSTGRSFRLRISWEEIVITEDIFTA